VVPVGTTFRSAGPESHLQCHARVGMVRRFMTHSGSPAIH
jgi:hypothetical protein